MLTTQTQLDWIRVWALPWITMWQESRYRHLITFAAGLFFLGASLLAAEEILLFIGDPHFASRVCWLMVFFLPVPLIVFFRWTGFALAVLACWGWGYLSGVLIWALDPTREGVDMFGHLIWIMTGYLISAVYCVPLMATRDLVAYLSRDHTHVMARQLFACAVIPVTILLVI